MAYAAVSDVQLRCGAEVVCKSELRRGTPRIQLRLPKIHELTLNGAFMNDDKLSRVPSTYIYES
jgi:hypothetical protein